MRIHGAALVAALLPLGCGSAPTSIVLHVTGPAESAVRALTAGGVSGAPAALTVQLHEALPISYQFVTRDVIESLALSADATAADGTALHGTTTAATSPHHQLVVELPLAGPAAPPPPDLGAAGDVCATAGAPTACAALGALFCDGFESSSGAVFPLWHDGVPVLDNYNGGAANSATKVTTAAAPACRGGQAMHAHVVGAAQQAYLQSNVVASRPSPLYVRAFVYLPSHSTLVPFFFVTFNSSKADPFLQIGIDPTSAAGGFRINASYDLGPGLTPIAGTVPLDRWSCVEVRTDFDAAKGSIAVSVDGVPRGRRTGLDTQPAGTKFDLVSVGVVAADVPSGGAFDLYVDEVVFSSQPIGCS